MKELKVIFTEAEFRKIKTAKKKHYAKQGVRERSWHDYVLLKCSKGVSEKHDKTSA